MIESKLKSWKHIQAHCKFKKAIIPTFKPSLTRTKHLLWLHNANTQFEKVVCIENPFLKAGSKDILKNHHLARYFKYNGGCL